MQLTSGYFSRKEIIFRFNSLRTFSNGGRMIFSLGVLLLKSLIAASTLALRSRKHTIFPKRFFSFSTRFVRLNACNNP